jgi:hypothetical protein
VTSLIVGSLADVHVQAVLKVVQSVGAPPPIVTDARSLQEGGFTLSGDCLHTAAGQLSMSEGRGWLRRYAPSGWGSGVVGGSLEAAVHRSFLTLVGNISRTGGLEWLTRVDEMLRAEDRMVQLETAASIGIKIPRTLITSSAERAIQVLGPRFIVKPLSLGFYWGPDGPRAIYTSEMDEEKSKAVDFGGAPFMAQELIEPERHLRVVTVRDQSWLAALDARGRPLDWRQQGSAHEEWLPDEDRECGRMAVQLSSALGVGYSSQDWLVRGAERFFIDFNPGGQWLFLPPDVASPVTAAIATFLSETS